MTQTFDLFGDPIPENWGKRGRPQHVPTLENRRKVNMLLAFGWNNERIARALHITPPSLRKHYFTELRYRDEARDRLDATLAMTLWRQAEAGSVSAIRSFATGIATERSEARRYWLVRGGTMPSPSQ